MQAYVSFNPLLFGASIEMNKYQVKRTLKK